MWNLQTWRASNRVSLPLLRHRITFNCSRWRIAVTAAFSTYTRTTQHLQNFAPGAGHGHLDAPKPSSVLQLAKLPLFHVPCATPATPQASALQRRLTSTFRSEFQSPERTKSP